MADVRCNGEDAGRRMVAEGWAWVYDYHGIVKKRGGDLFRLEAAARAQHLGLWADTAPTPPWDWRRERREQPRNHNGGTQPWGDVRFEPLS